MVIFESASKLWLILHTISAIVLLGSITHDFVLLISYVRGNPKRIRLQKRYAQVGFISFLCTYLLGGIFLYPVFKVRVRYPYFDKILPWATYLFEVKEHWDSMALAIFIVYYILSRYINPKEDKHLLKLYAILGIILAVIVWYSAIASFVLTSYRSV